MRPAPGLALALAACLVSSPVAAAAPPMVVVQAAPGMAQPLATDLLPVAAPVVPGAALAALAPVDAVLATAPATEPAVPVTEPAATVAMLAVADSAAAWPRPILSGLPLLAMLIGAALVAVGWRRARR